MNQRHDAQIAAIDAQLPRSTLGKRVLIAFVAIPVALLVLGYLDASAGDVAAVSGLVASVRVDLTENTPVAARRTITVQLNDGTTVQCEHLQAIGATS